MPVVGLALLLLGYSFVYSGASNLVKGDKGWGFLESLLGPNFGKKGAFGNTQLASFNTQSGTPASTPGSTKSPTTQGIPQAGTPAALAPGGEAA